MSDEAPTQAELFLEHAVKDASIVAALKSGDWQKVEAVARSLDYNFTKPEFLEAAQDVLGDELEDEQLERIAGGISDEEWGNIGGEIFGALGDIFG